MSRLLSQGCQGQDVRAVQDVLNYHIRRMEPLAVDGIFGPKTDARVREFQRSNKLSADGIVGPNTSALLFQETIIPFTLLLVPTLQLTFPNSTKHGIQPPHLIPPLQWPGPGSSPLFLPPPLLPAYPFRLSPSSTVLLPPLGNPGNALNLHIKVPTRNDPVDPFLRSYKSIVELIDDLPVNSKFRAFLISKVPDPITKITPPKPGFDWGLKPDFTPIDPNGFGVKGNAEFTIRVIGDGRPDSFNMNFGAWGDGKFFLDFSGKKGQSRPKIEAEGLFNLGIKGSF